MCVWLKLFKTLALQTIFEHQKDNKRVFTRKNHTFSKEASTFSNRIQGRARLANDQNKEHKVSEEKKSLITFCPHSLGSSRPQVFQQVLVPRRARGSGDAGVRNAAKPGPCSQLRDEDVVTSLYRRQLPSRKHHGNEKRTTTHSPPGQPGVKILPGRLEYSPLLIFFPGL